MARFHRDGAQELYIFESIQALADRSENHYVVFAKAAHIRELDIHTANFTFIPVDHRIRPARLLWEQTGPRGA